MDAFRHKPGYATGAGECVSLAALYAAALFVVGRHPAQGHLPDGHAAALAELRGRRRRHPHQQPPAGDQDHVVQRHRALRPGPPRAGERARDRRGPRDRLDPHPLPRGHHRPERLRPLRRQAAHASCRRPLTPEILGNFLRHSPDLQKCFQVRWRNFGVDHYIAMEKLFAYERGCPYRFNDDTARR